MSNQDNNAMEFALKLAAAADVAREIRARLQAQKKPAEEVRKVFRVLAYFGRKGA